MAFSVESEKIKQINLLLKKEIKKQSIKKNLCTKESPELQSGQAQQDPDVCHRRERTQGADGSVHLSTGTGMSWPWVGAWDSVILHFQRLQNYTSGGC